MRKTVSGIVIGVLIVFMVRYCEFRKETSETLVRSTQLIEEQIQNVGKLVVTEGNYAQVFTFENAQQYFSDWISSTKKAVVLVNAKAQVAYDLSQIQTQLDEKNKTVTITHIPEPELSIDPDIQYYDINNGLLNRFEASDLNRIQQQIRDSLQSIVRNSELMSNAQNRLVSELQKIYILTNSMDWTLEYKGQEIKQEADLERINR